MTGDWKQVWNDRATDEGRDLASLLRLDGFDTAVSRVQVEDWRAYASLLAGKLGLRDGASVYEVGCGSGALLYALSECRSITVGGLDFSGVLIDVASQVLPAGDIRVAEAKDLETVPCYDYVVAHGVFHYFPLDYAAGVLDRMIQKATVAAAVMEIPDLATRDESEALRRQVLGPREYEQKYSDLKHTYYARDWFRAQAEHRGLQCDLFDGCLPNYAQNPFRFGCIIRKP